MFGANESFHLRKAEECYKAAGLALEAQCWESAVSRAYYCAYHLLLEVMLRFGQPSPGRGWSHDSLQKRFIESFCERGFQFNKRDGKVFIDALAARITADYHSDPINETRSRRTVSQVGELRIKVKEVLNV